MHQRTAMDIARAIRGGTDGREGSPMQRHREPLAAIVAALAVFGGIVAPALMLVVAVSLAGAGLAVLALSVVGATRTEDRRGMQNPR